MRIVVLLLFLTLITFAEPGIAIRQGTATADLFIKRYRASGDYPRLALWHEAAAECLKRISVPMNRIAHDYYVRHGYKKWAARAKKEAQEIQEQYQYHRTHAKVAWQKFVGGVCNPDSFSMLDAERENIKKFIATWLPRYPDRFYEFGIYPTFFRKERELAEQERDYVKALHLEADAAEMCAAQYEQIPLAYGLKCYEKLRNAYLRHAMHLRSLAKRNSDALPFVTQTFSVCQSEIDKGKQILRSLKTRRIPSQQTVDAVLQIAKADARIKAALAGQNSVHAYPTFQGFVWIVSFSNQSRGNIATAIVDEETAEVLDVF